MLREHVITYHGQLTIADLEYIAQKAARLGASGARIVSAYQEYDREGCHLYFATIGSRHDPDPQCTSSHSPASPYPRYDTAISSAAKNPDATIPDLPLNDLSAPPWEP